MGFKNKRTVTAIAISALLHGIAFYHMRAPSSSTASNRPLVQLDIVLDKKEAPPIPAVRPMESGAPAVSAARQQAHLATADEAHLAVTDERPVLTTNGEAGPNTTLATSPGNGKGEGGGQTPDMRKPVIRALTFSDFERVMGETAKRDREEYRIQKDAARRERGAFVAPDPRVREALWKHRSFASAGLGLQLPLGENKSLASGYLLSIHQRMAPRFSGFLHSLDSPFERMHRKMQEGPLKYNPFYVAPPLEARQETMRGPLSDLSLNAMTEFEIMTNGDLGEVRLVRTSSSEVFDAATINAILKSAPFTPPPPTLISRNDRTYVQWTFFRDWTKNTAAQGHLLLLAPKVAAESLKLDAGMP